MKQEEQEELINLKLKGYRMQMEYPLQLGGIKEFIIRMLDVNNKPVKSFKYKGDEIKEAEEFANSLFGKRPEDKKPKDKE